MSFIERLFQNLYDLGRHYVCNSPVHQFCARCQRHRHVSLRSPVDQDFPVIPVFPDHEWNASDWAHTEGQRPGALLACSHSVDPDGDFLNASLFRRKGNTLVLVCLV